MTEQKNNVKFIGCDEWINLRTDEKRRVDAFEKPIASNSFAIAYLAEIITLVDKQMGAKKIQVVKYILENMDKNNNTLIITYRELAKRSNASYKTVADTLKLLKDAALVETRNGAIVLNPKLSKKSDKKASIMITYKSSEK